MIEYKKIYGNIKEQIYDIKIQGKRTGIRKKNINNGDSEYYSRFIL